MSPRSNDAFVTASEAGRILRLGRSRIAVLAAEGQLPFRETAAGYRLFPRRELEALAASPVNWRRTGRPRNVRTAA